MMFKIISAETGRPCTTANSAHDAEIIANLLRGMTGGEFEIVEVLI